MIPATFFVVGNYIDTAPELVLRMVQEGHIVGNHTLHHPDMSAIQDEASFSAELDGLADKYRELTGEEMKKFYRRRRGNSARAISPCAETRLPHDLLVARLCGLVYRRSADR